MIFINFATKSIYWNRNMAHKTLLTEELRNKKTIKLS